MRKKTQLFFYRLASAPENPPTCISIKKYGEKYFLSRYQIKRLLAKKIICGVRLKGHIFVADTPPDN
jgi:hypothetical protein